MSMRITRSVQATGRLEVEPARPWRWLTATGRFSAQNDPGKPARFVYESESASYALASFVASRRAGDPPSPGVAPALRVQRVLDTIYASVRSGGVTRSVGR